MSDSTVIRSSIWNGVGVFKEALSDESPLVVPLQPSTVPVAIFVLSGALQFAVLVPVDKSSTELAVDVSEFPPSLSVARPYDAASVRIPSR